ncbi:MAG: isocitrate dehydrogenase (NADP(+)) [Bacteroidetes bacterium MED-G17]|nr:MAG: isocitrate dehydrogenase (NADP(+)) [Bacteroidetes bacterium TMED39]PDH52242.1 MAG: isocitrate dehydrogenase (NADP(+)) [Bacteroidetes bacterium MED-G17]CAI8313310.1 MAG: Isocitrate dehydrogenase [NADP] [Bacteroidetes bacterium MED-G17]
MKRTITYTLTDEAPMLATYSLLPIVKSFLNKIDVEVELKNISLAARILAQFPEQQVTNDLNVLGKMVKMSDSNIIKLPNISASVPQLKNAIKELQDKGYLIPNFPENPQMEKEKEVVQKYNRVKGSAVNPVLREGNSDRRAPKAVKNFAKKNPHRMGNWSKDSKTRVATMQNGDFFHNEKALTLKAATKFKIVFEDTKGKQKELRAWAPLEAGEILDASVFQIDKLCTFLEAQLEIAKKENLLFSAHLKATMMKVSDPIIFGHVVKIYFKELWNKYGTLLDDIHVNPNDGVAVLEQKLAILSTEKQEKIKNEMLQIIANQADLAMVNSANGISNLHVPSDVIIDASMPAMIREGGKMWNKEGKIQDTLAVIPESSYAAVYQATIDFCKENGAFDPKTMGTVSNIGLMAQKAQEYGSHDKTFELKEAGIIHAIDEKGNTLISKEVASGDIFRMCQVKDLPIQNWIDLGIERAEKTGDPAVFWLDENRPHDKEIILKLRHKLNEIDTSHLNIKILNPEAATRFTLQRVKNGEDTISVTGNVLRDYLTDLFPILELGTSAKMLSIVPLIMGGGLFETGAGGSAPKHVEQLIKENYLRWDSLGEFLAIAVSLEHLAQKNNNEDAQIMANSLDQATEKLLKQGKSPSRKLGGIDNRGSHFYLALYWAEKLAEQDKNQQLKRIFSSLYKQLAQHEETINKELIQVQGKTADIGGYYWPNEKKTIEIMRPSKTFNELLDKF